MSKEYIQPPDLLPSEKFGYTQVVTSPPGKLVFLSGQTALDSKLEVVGGEDLSGQAEAALSNLGIALRAAGAEVSDVTSLRIYVVDYSADKMRALGGPLERFLGGSKPPAQTLIGVAALALPGIQIEIEAMAVVGG